MKSVYKAELNQTGSLLLTALNLKLYNNNEASYKDVLVFCKHFSMNLLYMSDGLVDGLEGTVQVGFSIKWLRLDVRQVHNTTKSIFTN